MRVNGNPKPAPDAPMGSPEIWAWLDTLDHPTCTRDQDGRCMSIHCVRCGAAMGGGLAPCVNGCNPR